jgi:hypothetical protein
MVRRLLRPEIISLAPRIDLDIVALPDGYRVELIERG